MLAVQWLSVAVGTSVAIAVGAQSGMDPGVSTSCHQIMCI